MLCVQLLFNVRCCDRWMSRISIWVLMVHTVATSKSLDDDVHNIAHSKYWTVYTAITTLTIANTKIYIYIYKVIPISNAALCVCVVCTAPNLIYPISQYILFTFIHTANSQHQNSGFVSTIHNEWLLNGSMPILSLNAFSSKYISLPLQNRKDKHCWMWNDSTMFSFFVFRHIYTWNDFDGHMLWRISFDVQQQIQTI